MLPIAHHVPAIHRSAEDLQAEIIKPGDMTPEQLIAWAEMRAAEPSFQSPLLSPDFAIAIGRFRPDTRVAIFKRGQQSVGFLPFHARPHRRARPLGSPFSDLHALITNPGETLDPTIALKAAGISGFRFSGLVDPFALFSGTIQDATPSFVLKVEDNPQEVLARLAERSPKRFTQYRRLARKLERENGPLTLTIGDHDRAAFDALMAWKRSQYAKNGLHDVLSPAWVRALMNDLFEQRGNALQGCLVTLCAGDRTVAAEFGLREGGAFHPWISAYDPSMASYSPGMLLMVRMIKVMPDNGLDTYDLGPSAENYKVYFSSEVRSVGRGVAGENAGRIRALAGAIPNDRLRAIAQRIVCRMDHVAATELTTWGQARGLFSAFAATPTRLATAPKSEPKEASRPSNGRIGLAWPA